MIIYGQNILNFDIYDRLNIMCSIYAFYAFNSKILKNYAIISVHPSKIKLNKFSRHTRPIFHSIFDFKSVATRTSPHEHGMPNVSRNKHTPRLL